MEFTTIRLAHKKSDIEIESLKHYDIYSEVSKIAELHNEFKIYKGKKFYDLIDLVDPWNVSISENFKKVLEMNKLTGWKCYPMNYPAASGRGIGRTQKRVN